MPVARGPVPRKAPQPPLHIKVLTDLSLLFLPISIDIKVLADLEPILPILPILEILLQTTKRAGHIKVLTDLSLSFLLMSIDIKVFQTFVPYSRAAPSCSSWPSWPSCFRQKKARREKIKTPARNPCKRG